MLLDDDNVVYFGQHLKDVEKVFLVVATDNPSPVARKGIDKKIKTELISFDFDSDLLNTIEFAGSYQFKRPPKPYEKTWKNFVPITNKAIKAEMNRSEFVDYLSEWEHRAQSLGAKKIASGDLNEDEYHISFTTRDRTDMIHISMGVSRRAGGGGIWADGWSVFFTTKEPLQKLKSLSAFCDQFNTVARR